MGLDSSTRLDTVAVGKAIQQGDCLSGKMMWLLEEDKAHKSRRK
jgi:hypothetical protein